MTLVGWLICWALIQVNLIMAYKIYQICDEMIDRYDKWSRVRKAIKRRKERDANKGRVV